MRGNYFHVLLILGRASNLPTVCSNCIAASFLAGTSTFGRISWTCLAGSLLYVGGMFLNDAFDAEFDRQFRRERPIPSGRISETQVWLWGGGFLVAGLAISFYLGKAAFLFSILLAASILLYNWLHKAIEFSPVLMATCRFFLYLFAGSAVLTGSWGFAFWPAVAMAAYIIGLSYIARKETGRGAIKWWPACFLAFPVFLAFIVNDGIARTPSFFWMVLAASWALFFLKHTFWSNSRNVPRTVTGLLAGIVLIDGLLTASPDLAVNLLFLVLFFLCLILQRYIPAT